MKVPGTKVPHTRYVSARMRKALGEADPNGIADLEHDNGNIARGELCGTGWLRGNRYKEVGLSLNKFCGKLWQALVTGLRRLPIEYECASFDPSQLSQLVDQSDVPEAAQVTAQSMPRRAGLEALG